MLQKAIETKSRNCVVDITPQILSAINEMAIENGALMVYVPHTTSAVMVNEGADPDVVTDVLNKLEQLVPYRGNYRHIEGNSDAHIKSAIIGESVLLPVSRGSLKLGTWQKVFFCEFDGPRSRKFYIIPISPQ